MSAMSYDNWNGGGAQSSGWYGGDTGGAQYNMDFGDGNSGYDAYGGNQMQQQYSVYNVRQFSSVLAFLVLDLVFVFLQQSSPQQGNYYGGNMFMPNTQVIGGRCFLLSP